MDAQDARSSGVSIDEIYRQQYAHFSRMNDLFYKLPIGFSTIIGGLWFFGASMIERIKSSLRSCSPLRHFAPLPFFS